MCIEGVTFQKTVLVFQHWDVFFTLKAMFLGPKWSPKLLNRHETYTLPPSICTRKAMIHTTSVRKTFTNESCVG